LQDDSTAAIGLNFIKMKKTVAFFSIIFFLFSCENDSDSLSSIEGTGSSLARFTIKGDFLYVVNDNDMYSIDITAPETPEVKNFANIGRRVETIYPFKDYLLIGSSDAMYIYSLADNPASPEYLSTFRHWGACDPVVAQGDYAYVTLREGSRCSAFAPNQLEVVNIADPKQPSLVAQLQMSHPHGLGVSGDKLFVCEGSHGLTQVDISDPHNPKIEKTYPDFHAYDVLIKNDLLIVTGNDGYFQFNITEEGLEQVSTIHFL
jgi:hypothetical protein